MRTHDRRFPPGDLTNDQAARLLGVSLTTINKLVREGRLSAYKLGSDKRAGRRIVRTSIERLRNATIPDSGLPAA